MSPTRPGPCSTRWSTYQCLSEKRASMSKWPDRSCCIALQGWRRSTHDPRGSRAVAHQVIRWIIQLLPPVSKIAKRASSRWPCRSTTSLVGEILTTS